MDWSDYCAVQVEETEAQQWVAQIEVEGEDDVELGESFPQLDPQKNAEARAEELAYIQRRGLWRAIPIPPGVVLVSVRWVDVQQFVGTGLQEERQGLR